MRVYFAVFVLILGSLGLSQTTDPNQLPPITIPPPAAPVPKPTAPKPATPKPVAPAKPVISPAPTVPVTSRTIETIKARGRLILAVDPQFAPFALRDEKSKIVGFDLDLARSFAAQLGVPLEAQTILFSGLLPAVKSGRVDLAGSGLTTTKRKDVLYSDVFFDNAQIFAVQAGNPKKFVLGADLTGKQIGVRANTIGFLAAFQKLVPLGAKIKVFDSNQKALADLQTGKLEALILDLPSFEAYRGRRTPIDQIAGVLVQERYSFAVPSDSDILPVLNQAIAAWKKNGGYAKALEKWILDR